MSKPTKSYSRSFTAGALMLTESTALVDLYLDIKDWTQVKKDAVEKNILHARTKASLIRMVRETVTRLSNFSDSQIALFSKSDKTTKQLLLWYAICKTFPFINEFAKEILHEKYLKLEPLLSLEDINVFFTKKAGWDEELESKSESTKLKMKQVLLRMLREAEFIDSNDRILPAFLSAEFLSCMSSSGDWHHLYPAQAPIQENIR